MSSCMKILPVGAELFNADGRTDGRKDMNLVVAFNDLANSSKNAKGETDS